MTSSGAIRPTLPKMTLNSR